MKPPMICLPRFFFFFLFIRLCYHRHWIKRQPLSREWHIVIKANHQWWVRSLFLKSRSRLSHLLLLLLRFVIRFVSIASSLWWWWWHVDSSIRSMPIASSKLHIALESKRHVRVVYDCTCHILLLLRDRKCHHPAATGRREIDGTIAIKNNNTKWTLVRLTRIQVNKFQFG